MNSHSCVHLQATNESLGMRIGGGVSSNEGDTPIYIANINPQGPVGRCRTIKVSPKTLRRSERMGLFLGFVCVMEMLLKLVFCLLV